MFPFLKDSLWQPSLHKHTSHFRLTPGARRGAWRKAESPEQHPGGLGKDLFLALLLCFLGKVHLAWHPQLLSLRVRSVDGWWAHIQIIGKTDCLSILFTSVCSMTLPPPIPGPAFVSWCPVIHGMNRKGGVCEASPIWGHYSETTSL